MRVLANQTKQGAARISPAEAFASALLEGTPKSHRGVVYSRLKKGVFKNQKATQNRLEAKFKVKAK